MPPYTNRIVKKVLDICARNMTGSITNVATEKHIASITFDDGPDPVYTLKVLELLKKYDAQATFFMTGRCVQSHPEIVKRVAKEGHAIGNHSWDHYAFNIIALKEHWEQIKKCHNALKPYGLRLFRPPYGLTSCKSDVMLFFQGYKTVGWSIDSMDWREPDSKIMEQNLLESIKPGSIILFHDRIYDGGNPERGPIISQEAVTDREPMLRALDGILNRLNKKIQFVTLPVLLRNGRPLRDAMQS